jgi:hypothetical protein
VLRQGVPSAGNVVYLRKIGGVWLYYQVCLIPVQE